MRNKINPISTAVDYNIKLSLLADMIYLTAIG
jgi:hypothetical protein